MHIRHILKEAKKVKLPSTGWYIFTLLLFLGVLIFEVTRMSYAQTTFKYPTALPPNDNPTVTTGGGGGTVAYDECAQGLFVGLSTDEYKIAMSYKDADEKCNTTFSGSHVCTTGEMLKTISCDKTPSPFDQFVGNAVDHDEGWINNGPFTSGIEVNDCRGWTYNVAPKVGGGDKTSLVKGTTWLFEKGKSKYGYGYSRSCKQVNSGNLMYRKFTCCK